MKPSTRETSVLAPTVPNERASEAIDVHDENRAPV
jgi:hypothetical protein